MPGVSNDFCRLKGGDSTSLLRGMSPTVCPVAEKQVTSSPWLPSDSGGVRGGICLPSVCMNRVEWVVQWDSPHSENTLAKDGKSKLRS